MTSWQFDEFQQVGRDYGNPREVEIYDSTQADFRDVEAESKELLDLLALASSDVLIDSVRERGRLPSRPRAAVPACMRCFGGDDRLCEGKGEYRRNLEHRFSHAGFLTTNISMSRQPRSRRRLPSITCPTAGRELLWRECAPC
jgi:hypothetical protein